MEQVRMLVEAFAGRVLVLQTQDQDTADIE